jgi:chitinase
MPVAVREEAAVLGPNGKVYVLGGSNGTAATATVQVYDLTTDTWTTDTDLPAPVRQPAAVLDAQGRVKVLGGFDAGGAPVANVYKTQRLTIPDSAPVITSSAVTTASLGGTYTYQVVATGNPEPTFSLSAAPDGRTIDSRTGRITWVPAFEQLGESFPVTVVATNSVGQGPQSFNVTVRDTTPPTVPTNVQTTNITPNSVTLTWAPSTDDVAVAGYKVYTAVFVHNPRGSGGTWFYTLRATVSDTTATIGGLAPNQSYQFTVTAFDTSNNQSGYSTPYVGVTTTEPPVFGTPIGSTTVVANHSINLQVYAFGNPSAITYSVLSGPADLTIDPTNGRVSWAPTPDEVGS